MHIIIKNKAITEVSNIFKYTLFMIKKSKQIVYRVLPVLVLVIFLTSCKICRFAYYNFADITDHKIFPARTASAPDTAFKYIVADDGVAPKEIIQNGKSITFDEYLASNKTVAFLIIKNDTIQYEEYFNGYSQDDIVASFDVAKSITSILIGCAIDDGYIQSTDEPITNYIPELKENGLSSVTIEHLLQMGSGIKFNESHINPFGDAATYYYGRNLTKAILKMKPERKPNRGLHYSSGDTQVLGMILQRALPNITITEYLEKKLWQPMGMEYDATWSLDKENGLEKTFCCINARARDFSKIGRLYLNKGNWNGKQLVSKRWVERSTTANTVTGTNCYKYQWWLPSSIPGDYNNSFLAQGILGQYIFVNPDKNLIIVRLGKGPGKDYNKNGWVPLFKKLAERY